MIVVIDYGLGNVRSIYAKIEQMGKNVLISREQSDIEAADKIILPGVGAFDAGMENLKGMNIIPLLERSVLREHIPILGICLGMQILTQKSEEGVLPGLGYFDANTVRFNFTSDTSLKIPHMGWNTVNFQQDCPLFEGIPNNSRFYFVHSYHVNCHNHDDAIAITQYGYEYPSIIQKGNIYGVQFHPEKSHKQGIQILKNFSQL